MKFQLSVLSLLITGSVSHVTLAQSFQAKNIGELCYAFPKVVQSHSAAGVLSIQDTAVILQKSATPYTLGFSSIVSQSASSCSTGTQSFACKADPNAVVSPLANIVLKHDKGDVMVRANESIRLGEDGECLTTDSCGFNDALIDNGTLYLEEGTYWFRELRLTGLGRLEINGNVRLYVQSLTTEGTNTRIIQNYAPDQFELLSKGDVVIKGASEFNALIYSETDVALFDQVVVTGAITARNVSLSNSVKVIGESTCLAPTNYTLQLEPKSDYANTRARIPITFSITNEFSQLQTVNGNLTAITEDDACWSDSKEGSCTSLEKTVSLTGGQTTLWLEKKSAGIVDIQARFSSSATGNLSITGGPYQFLSGGFEITADNNEGSNAAKMIAGKPQSFSIKALAGSFDSTIDTAYTGTKRLVIDLPNYLSPKLDINNKYTVVPTIIGRRDDEDIEEGLYQAIGIDVVFTNGYAENAFTVVYNDAGVLALSVSDPSVSQKGQSLDTTSEPTSRAITSLSDPKPFVSTTLARGDLVMHVRPYTFAICDLNVTQLDDEYVQFTIGMAGAPIKALLRPVIWLNGDAITSEKVIVTEEHCKRKTTNAFYHTDAPSSAVALDKTATVLVPSGGTNGTLSGDLVQANTEGLLVTQTSKLNYTFSDFTIDEVGLFGFHSYSPTTYLGMTINPGELRVERFYPAYFDVVPLFSTGISAYFDTLNEGFTYMEQGFQGGFTIYAMTAEHKRVKNYHLPDGLNIPGAESFEPATFKDFIAQQEPYNDVLMSNRWRRDKLPTEWTAGFDGASQMNYLDTQMYITKEKDPTGAITYDGPFYPLDFALSVDRGDRFGTNFRICGQSDDPLPDEPGCRDPVSQRTDVGVKLADMDIYFGRLRLEGFTEENDITKPEIIPAYVEYYDSQTGTFRTNTRDNATYVTVESGMSLKEILKSDTEDPDFQAKIELIEGTPELPGDPIAGKSRRVTEGVAPFLVTPYDPDEPGAPMPPDGSEGPYREQFKFWQLLDGDPTLVPEDPDNPNSSQITSQPWLMFPWDSGTTNTNPSAIGTYGFFTGHDKIIYRGEKNIRLVTGQ